MGEHQRRLRRFWVYTGNEIVGLSGLERYRRLGIRNVSRLFYVKETKVIILLKQILFFLLLMIEE